MVGGRVAALLAAALVATGCATTAPATPPASAMPPGTSADASPSAVSTSAAPASRPATPEPTTWAEVAATGPAPREDHTWTLDEASGIAYLFGGRDGATIFGDTWAFDLETDTWTELSPTIAPPARFGHEAVWVDGIGVVLFAGQAGATFYGDLWALDPGGPGWRPLPASGAAPTPRYGSCAGVGPDGRLWISHGFTQDQVRFSDTRAYDFATATWTDETPADGRPVERCLHGCWWTEGGELALFGGQTTGTTALDDRWLLDDGAWVRVDAPVPPARNLYARVRVDGGTLVFGGQASDGSYLSDLWRLDDDGTASGPITGSGQAPMPVGRAGAEMISDAERDRILLFGGRTADGALGDMWELRGP